MDGLVAALATAALVDTFEGTMTATSVGSFQSLWMSGGRPGAGVIPATGSGAAPTNATVGAIPFTNPGGANTAYLARFFGSGVNPGSLLLYDRLVNTSGLSGIVTTAQAVASTAITRTYTPASTSAYLEVYTGLGATNTTGTCVYTNQSGTAGQTGTFSVPANAKQGLMIPILLAAGDTGVQTVTSVTLAASTGTAGNFGVTLAQRLVGVPLNGTQGSLLDYAATGMVIIQPNACLAYILLPSSTTTGAIISELTVAQG
jgi:hypothetical protein